MEHEHHGLVVLQAQVLLHVLLRVVQNLGVQLHVTGSVHAVHVAERSSHGEAGRDLAQRRVHLHDLLGLRVQARVLHAAVVHAVLLAASHTDLHLQQNAHLVAALQVLRGQSQVVVQRLHRQVDHVRRVQRSARLLEVLLIRLQAAVQPGQQLLGAVIRVKHHRHAVRSGHRVHVLGTHDRTHDGVALLSVGLQTLARDEGGTTVGELDDDGALHRRSSLETGVHRVRVGAVDGRNGESVLLGIAEQLHGLVASKHTRMKERKNT